jgi:hypothetical protein
MWTQTEERALLTHLPLPVCSHAPGDELHRDVSAFMNQVLCVCIYSA